MTDPTTPLTDAMRLDFIEKYALRVHYVAPGLWEVDDVTFGTRYSQHTASAPTLREAVDLFMGLRSKPFAGKIGGTDGE